MIRRILCIMLCLLCLAPSAGANLSKLPNREIFSLGYSRLQAAMKRGDPLSFSIRADVAQWGALDEALLEAAIRIFSRYELTGKAMVQGSGEGALALAMAWDGEPLIHFEQMEREGRIGLRLQGEAVSFPKDQMAESAGLLLLDDVGKALLHMDYIPLRDWPFPFLSALKAYGLRFGQFATPYGTDNGRLSAASGPTSHGMTYTLDTEALQDVLARWRQALRHEDFLLGLPGTPFSYGLSADAFHAFGERIGAFAEGVTVTGPIKVNMAYGAGDLLQTVRGSGTIGWDGRRTSISYRYNGSQTKTKTTKTFSLDFQPRGMDTLVAKGTYILGSDNQKSGAHEFSLNMDGLFDDKLYRIRVRSNMVNKYVLAPSGILTEIITGTASFSIRYDGIDILDITLTRAGETASSLESREVSIRESMDLLIMTGEETAFKGVVWVALSRGAAEEMPAFYLERPLESMDFGEVEAVRAYFADLAGQIIRGLVTPLPPALEKALAGPF